MTSKLDVTIARMRASCSGVRVIVIGKNRVGDDTASIIALHERMSVCAVNDHSPDLETETAADVAGERRNLENRLVRLEEKTVLNERDSSASVRFDENRTRDAHAERERRGDVDPRTRRAAIGRRAFAVCVDGAKMRARAPVQTKT